MNNEGQNAFQPIEVTTHNLTFHESPNITSLDYKNNFIMTSGQDKAVRLWEVAVTDKNKFYTGNCHKTAVNTSLKISFVREFTKFNDPVSIVRIYRETNDFIFAVGTEAGAIYYFKVDEKDVEKFIKNDLSDNVQIREEHYGNN